MKFSRLRLSGFKSFVEPTELYIEPGLTGVVGPNGCGKSNIVESLRWVMGETSSKSLRGSGMEDVIFSGTSGRPARNLAEVSLLIDNAERQVPSAYNDSDTVEISRQIERDRGSTYRINGREVRAKDVQLLFADLSIGAHSPAFVRQGQIGQLISAKPAARRNILEEAAGILGLHSRRHDAELRLRGAETNMERLDDVIAQLETQLDGLKRQARQATRFRNISGRVRKAEALVLSSRWLRAFQTVESEQTKLAEIDIAVAQRTQAAAGAAREQADAAEALPPLRDAEARAAAALHRLNAERESLDAEEARALKTREYLQTRATQITEDLAHERTVVADAGGAIKRLAEEEEGLLDERGRQSEFDHEVTALVEQASETLARRETVLDELTSRLAELVAQRSAFASGIEDADRRITRLAHQQAEVEAEQESLGGVLAGHAGSAGLEQQLHQARTAAREAEAGALAAEEEKSAAQAREVAAREPMIAAERLAERLETESKTLAAMLERPISGDWSPVLDAIIVEPGYEVALGAALGDELDAPAASQAPLHWETLPPLDGTPRLPEGAESLTRFVRGPAALTRRLMSIGLVDRADGKRLQEQLKQGQRLVSREGDLWRWDGFTVTADAPTAAAQRLAGRNRHQELQAEVARAQSAAVSARTAHETAQQVAVQADSGEAAKRTYWRESETALEKIRNQFADAERAIADQRSRSAALTDAHERVQAELTEANQAREQAASRLEALEPESAVNGRVEGVRSEVNELRDRLSEARGRLEGLRQEARVRDERLSTIERERGDWEGRVENSDGRIQRFEARQKEVETEIQENARLPQEIETRRGALLSRIGESEKTRDVEADHLAKAESRLAECDKTARETQATLADVREERARVDAQLEAAKERITEAEQRITETLGCAPQEALTEAGIDEGGELPEIEDAERRLERLKAERENMGGVNLRAEEEANELKEQLDTLSQERADLESAIARLRQGIGNLNRQARQRLLEAFDSVNENFQRLFRHLFEGGEARLELTDAEDPLEAGLEILARPPGKRTQVLSLLSGGEQALTAMALLFAVFNTNPAPICVLDEVDAPLDDANVERFCNLLDEMVRSTSTRFLVITHHALTVSRMNQLFGVTMTERGVSQLVSVDLEGAERFREAV